MIARNIRCGILAWSPIEGGHNTIVNNTIAENGQAFSFANSIDNIISNNLIYNNIYWENVSNSLLAFYGANNIEGMVIKNNWIYPQSDLVDSTNYFAKPTFLKYYLGYYFVKQDPSIPMPDTQYFVKKNFWGLEDPNNLYMGCFPYLTEEQFKAFAMQNYCEWPFMAHNDPDNQEQLPPDFWNPIN